MHQSIVGILGIGNAFALNMKPRMLLDANSETAPEWLDSVCRLSDPRGIHVFCVILYSILLRNHSVGGLSMHRTVEIKVFKQIHNLLINYFGHRQDWESGVHRDALCLPQGADLRLEVLGLREIRILGEQMQHYES